MLGMIFKKAQNTIQDPANLREPALLAQEIADDLRSAVEETEGVLAELPVRTPT